MEQVMDTSFKNRGAGGEMGNVSALWPWLGLEGEVDLSSPA